MEFDVLIFKLVCLNRFMDLFETIIVQSIISGQINLVVTCTGDCTCHYLTIPEKNLNFLSDLRYLQQI